MTDRRESAAAAFERLLGEVRACRACVEAPRGAPLPHAPRPVLRGRPSAAILVCGQAPGTRVHASGLPFDDPSGDRLRDWMGVTREVFYDEARIAFLPMGFCFPGLDAKGGDLPPRRECADLWRQRLLDSLPNVRLMLLVGQYAQRWHLSRRFAAPWRASLGDTVRDWRRIAAMGGPPQAIPLPHPSWRNNAWLMQNPWFGDELVPQLRRTVRLSLTSAPT